MVQGAFTGLLHFDSRYIDREEVAGDVMPVLNEKEKVNMMKYDLPLQLKKAIMRLGKRCGIKKGMLFVVKRWLYGQ